MDDHYRASIEALQTELKPLEEKLVKTKQLINLLCERAGVPAIYPDAELSVQNNAISTAEDEFYNKPLLRALKMFLSRRKVAGTGPATAEQIYDGLRAGGYAKFPSNRDEALNGLRISLGKSSHTFVKLPSGSYALTEWYGIKRQAKPTMAAGEKVAAGVGAADTEDGDDDENEEGTDPE